MDSTIKPLPQAHAHAGMVRRAAAGFTAVEMLVTIAILSILAGIAAPSFGPIIERYRVRSAIEDLSGSIYLARSEAIRRGGQVTLRSASSADCAPTQESDWRCGWLVFADTNADGVFDDGEQIIQATAPLRGVEAASQAATGSSLDNFRFDRWGQPNETASLSFTIRPEGNAAAQRASMLCMSGGGRLATHHGAGSC